MCLDAGSEPSSASLFMEDAAQLGEDSCCGRRDGASPRPGGLHSNSGWKEEFNEVLKKTIKKVQRHGLWTQQFMSSKPSPKTAV